MQLFEVKFLQNKYFKHFKREKETKSDVKYFQGRLCRYPSFHQISNGFAVYFTDFQSA